MKHALTNACVLTADGFAERQTVVICDGRIVAVVDDGAANLQDFDVHNLDGQRLLPGFVDIQVNGGGGVLFNDDPCVASIRTIGDTHRKFGTTGFLPTLISDDLEKVAAAIEAVDAAIEAGVPGVLGVHLEGPFLSAEKKGAHDASKFRELDDDAVALLSSLRNGKTLVTLAPETNSPELVQKLAGNGVTIWAGHSGATYAEARAAIAAGISGFTHLFNAMSPLVSREPGVVGAALDSPGAYVGLIVDGRHVHPAALRVALAAKPKDRCVLVTDAMPSVGMADKAFMLDGRAIAVADGVCVDGNGTLAGSDLDMAAAVRNAVQLLDIDLATAVRMASQYPAAAIRLGNELGCIKPGFRANMVLVDADMNVTSTWIDGQPAQ